MAVKVEHLKLPRHIRRAIKSGIVPVVRNWRALPIERLTRAEFNMRWIEEFCKVPEGDDAGKPLKIDLFFEVFMYAVFDAPVHVHKAILSVARKNAKTAYMSCFMLLFICGPEAKLNSRVVSGALSREQAAEIYNFASKMIGLSPELSAVASCTSSGKRITGLVDNVEYKALAAEGKTNHGKGPLLAVLDEVGQVDGPLDDFFEAIVTSQGALEFPFLVLVSTQARTDGDYFSIELDGAASNPSDDVVCHWYSADPDAEMDDREAWLDANPSLGKIKKVTAMEKAHKEAIELPSREAGFRWLGLNQRVNADNPFVARSVWESCSAPTSIPEGSQVYLGLDLSSVQDLTSLVMLAQINGVWHTEATFWLPADGLDEKAKADRVPYTKWRDQGFLTACPGKTVDLEYVAAHLLQVFERHEVRKLAFDRWGWSRLEPELLRQGMPDWQLEEVKSDFGQGFRSMSPALLGLENDLLNQRIAHGNHPVLNMCAANASVASDPAGNRKLVKPKERHRRIDGMVALAMAHSVAVADFEEFTSNSATGELFFA
jgi:phage terminase large subunit-like protein